MTPTDEDLRLVAEAVGLRREEVTNTKDEVVGHQWVASRADGKHIFWDSPYSSEPNLRNDDGLAAKFLLPWLQGLVEPTGHLAIDWATHAGWKAKSVKIMHWNHGVEGHATFSAALFDLCLRIIKENLT